MYAVDEVTEIPDTHHEDNGMFTNPQPSELDITLEKSLCKVFSKSLEHMDMDDRKSLEEMYRDVQSHDERYSELIYRSNRASRILENVRTTKSLHGAISVEEIDDVGESCCADKQRDVEGLDTKSGSDRHDNGEETVLAQKLRICCDPFGREKKDSIGQSAKIFLQLGKLYLRYASSSTGIEQKQNFIKATALLYGSIVRSNILSIASDMAEAKATLSHLHTVFLTAAQADEREYDNISILSIDIKTKLIKYRKNEQEDIKGITPITDFVDLQKEREKIKKVRMLCEKNTKTYISLMAEIAEKCVGMLGKPPCHFAILGLGSLARKEATLYSDFEHAIVLDDGVEERENYAAIKEYFRWYSVLFQIVIIGLGETFIRSVNVKSFCNLDSDDPANNWYFDVYTPCGIAFDGMAPHSSNIPLGRVEKTKRRKHLVELIQPVSKMVVFLTKHEELRNGYFLKDVLSQTCFVYGDHQVYHEYLVQSQALINSENLEDVVKHQLKIILQNPNESVKWFVPSVHILNSSMKASNYRPITTYIYFASRLSGIDTHPTFEAIEEMKRLGVIDAHCRHLLMYAVAVTIEGRVKSYLETGHQRKKLSSGEWASLVGLESAIEALTTLFVLRSTIVHMLLDSYHKKKVQRNLALPSRSSGTWCLARLKK